WAVWLHCPLECCVRSVEEYENTGGYGFFVARYMA
ncbi:hypothetical protein F441_05091, partial [Phytophthora nicotianae CJ01A1]